MANRQSLHAKLEQILGSSNVYFQPPETKKLSYPCIVYARDPKPVRSANNRAYVITDAYSLTLIQKTPEDNFVNELLTSFQLINHGRHYVHDNLNHDVFTLYY